MNKNIFKTIIFLILNLPFIGYSQCPNGDAELNNFTNWNGFTGLNNNGILNLNTFTSGIVPNRHTVTSAGNNDPITGFPVVAEGQHAIKLGNDQSGAEAEIISYTFVVTRPTVSFQYALVLEDPGHPQSENPFFEYWVSSSSNLTMSLMNLIDPGQKIIADQSNPFFTAIDYGGGIVVYKEWQTVCINLAEHLGDVVTIYFATADCSQQGHFGYAYIDGICKPNNGFVDFTYNTPICNIDNFVADGSASKNYNDHFWRVERLNSSDITDIVANTAVREDYPNTPVGQIDLRLMYLNGGGTLVNGFYKVTLGIKNCNGEWEEKSVVIEVALPVIKAENSYACCEGGNPVEVQLLAEVIADNSNIGTFTWYDENGNVVPSTTILTSMPPNNTIVESELLVQEVTYGKYKVEYVDQNGCKSDKWVYAVVIPGVSSPHFPKITDLGCDAEILCSSRTLRISIRWDLACFGAYPWNQEYEDLILEAFSFQWNTGETTRAITTTFPNEDYECIITWPCGEETVQYHIDYPTGPHLSGSQLSYTTGVQFGAGHYFRIFDSSLPALATPAYNASRYILRIYNRWGELVYEKDEYMCYGFFANGDISWNQIGNVGNHNGIQQPGAGTRYDFYLHLGNCTADVDDHPQGNPELQGNFYIY